MMHVLILGMTESGKSNMLKVLIEKYRRNNFKSIVLDPLKDPEFNADFQSNTPDEFLHMVFGSRSCLVGIDESGKAVGRYNDTMNELATMGRHWGHSCVFCCQKATQLAPIVREQCGAIFMFTSGKASGKMIAEEFNCDEFLKVTNLPQGHYLFKTRFGELQKGNVFDDLKKVGLFKAR